MQDIHKIIAILLLIIVGLNLSANNAFNSLLVTYVFYKDAIAGKLLRLFGIIVALSSILIILGMTSYCIYLNIIILLLLTFFSIRGRNKSFKDKMNARDTLLKEYENEIKEKREKLAALKNKTTTKKEDTDTGKSVSTIKKEMWDDGTMTSKDLINGFKDSEK